MRALGVVAVLLIAVLAYVGWREWTAAPGPAGPDRIRDQIGDRVEGEVAGTPGAGGTRGRIVRAPPPAGPATALGDGAPAGGARASGPLAGVGDQPPAQTDPAFEAAAEQFIATLKPTGTEPIPAGQADHFVPPSQRVRLGGERPIETATLRELTLELPPNAPVTVVREVRQIELSDPDKLIAESGGDLDRKIEVLLGEEVKALPLRQVLAEHAGADGPISVVKLVDYFEPTTPAELARAARESGRGWDHLLRVIKQPYRIGSVTVADLLAGIKPIARDTILYVHSVEADDVQGVWGIVHTGLIDKFARGLAIRRGEAVTTYRVRIPQDADERASDASSSFLGRLIDEKTRESAVYNFRIGKMSRNPDLIIPGDQIVIVDFTPDELISIYEHFLQLQRRTADRS